MAYKEERFSVTHKIIKKIAKKHKLTVPQVREIFLSQFYAAEECMMLSEPRGVYLPYIGRIGISDRGKVRFHKIHQEKMAKELLVFKKLYDLAYDEWKSGKSIYYCAAKYKRDVNTMAYILRRKEEEKEEELKKE